MKKEITKCAFLAVVLVLLLVMVGCGSSGVSQQGNEASQTTTVAKTGGVKMRIDLNALKTTAKSVYGGGIDMLNPSIIQGYKDDVTSINIYVRTEDNQMDVTSFENLPVVNGVFETTQADGSSLINLPAGNYMFLVDLLNARGTARFSGRASISVLAGEQNACVIEMELNNIFVGIAIKQMQGNFDKSDGTFFQGIYYKGNSNADNWIFYGSDQMAYMDFNGTLHATIEVSSLNSKKVYFSVTDKDGKVILQTLELEMSTVIAAEMTGNSVEYVYQKTDAVSVSFTFPQ